jgi:hypothetical protein
MPMNIWEVYEEIGNVYDYIDTVYFSDDCDENYIKDTLIYHDGYPDNIVLEQIGIEGEVI